MISVECNHQDYKNMRGFDAVPVMKCNKCGLIFTDKIWKGKDLENIYENYYKNEMSSRFNSAVEAVVRFFRFFRAFKIFTIYPRAKKILDVGSGRGFTLYFLKKFYKYKRTAGTQVSRNAFEFSKNKLGLEIYNRDLLELDFGGSGFDIITMWHVLEHVNNPERYISKIHALLQSRGKMVIEVPNFNSWSRALTSKYWLGLDLQYHSCFFTPESLLLLIKKYNFNVRLVRTFSLEYSTFISAQSLVSFITKTNHIFFQRLQSDKFKFDIQYVLHTLYFLALAPLCFLINSLLYFSKRGEILLIVAQKD